MSGRAQRPSRGGRRAAAGLAVFALAACGLGTLACSRSSASDASGPRVIVLGFDGMDHGLATRYMAEGRMPALSRLAAAGGFTALETAVPPQSPVAWSEFITGLDAGGHGIFDFLHRDPASRVPYFSTSQVEKGSGPVLPLGSWRIPLGGGDETVLLRRGEAFWETLAERGVESWIVRIPANYPPSGKAEVELSGMGTTDLLGTPGTFFYYTSELFALDRDDPAGGKIHPVDYWQGVAEGTLYGPPNTLRDGAPPVSLDFTAYVDPQEDVARLLLGEEERILQVGEWSDWVRVEFPLLPAMKLSGLVRLYLKQVRPEFQLYVSPLQIDPLHPAMPISHPEAFAGDLARATGLYYTQGMPEDTQAWKADVLSFGEFLAQAEITGGQFLEQYDYVLDRFDGGLLFYYFGHLDQVSHVLFRTLDPGHPAYDPETDPAFADVIPSLYEELDRVVGRTLEQLGEDDLLVVMSDHGFGSWRRTFHLNEWLAENGYLALQEPRPRNDPGLFQSVDWSRTRAYGVGLNGLYVNQRGREPDGVVPAEQSRALLAEISEKLLATVDPATGQPAVTEMVSRWEFRDRQHLDVGPDAVVGYAKGTRGSGKSALGEFTGAVLSDNLDDWSGDHCWDHRTVPGILASSRPLGRPVTRLAELAGAIVAEFGVEEFPRRSGE